MDKFSTKFSSECLNQAASQRNTNCRKRVSGKRLDIPAMGRKLNIVFYKTAVKNAPLVLGFHGGGFLFGGNSLHDQMWKNVAKQLKVNVVSVEYRKSPDFGFAEAIMDAFEAFLYFKFCDKTLDYNREDIRLLGFDAGANLCATLCLLCKNNGIEGISQQILCYPVLDYTDKPGCPMSQDLLLSYMRELHCTREQAANPYVSPVCSAAGTLKGLPKTTVILAENDIFRPEGEKYVQLLKADGVAVKTLCVPKMPHEFFEFGFSDATDAMLFGKNPELYKCIKCCKAHHGAQTVLDFLKADS